MTGVRLSIPLPTYAADDPGNWHDVFELARSFSPSR
jgi:hypothetical protein